jgi:hypothetical protein
MAKAPAKKGEAAGSSPGAPKHYDEIIRVLIEVKLRNQKVKDLLKRYPPDDVEEFGSTNLIVEATVNRLLNSEPARLHISLTASLSLQDAVKSFQSYISKLDEGGKLKRYLTNSHLRGKLESLNSAIDGELRIVATETKTLEPRKSFSKIRDDEGQEMWQKEFGAHADQIQWNTFIKGLNIAVHVYGTTITEEDEHYLRVILDNSRTGFVSCYRFSEFLKGFGPLKRSIGYMKSVMREKWFYGFLSGEESLRLLQGQPTGTYMVRFSRSKPGSFALSFVWTNGDVLPVLINGCMPEGLKIKEQGDVERKFDSLYEVLDYYKKWLLIPFSGQLSKEAWFHGDVSLEETEELLAAQKPGTFLIRFGDSDGSYWCSYVTRSGSIDHVEIRSDSSGFSLPQEQKGTTFATLNEYVRANRHILRYNYDTEGIPQLRIKPLDGKVVKLLQGPEDPMQPGEVHDRLGSGKAISTYPGIPGGYSLICDRFALQVLGNWVLCAVADGCNWGLKPQEAAVRATAGFLGYITEQSSRMPDLKEIGHCLLRGFNVAHSKIVEGKADALDAGTTTLLAGMLVELTEQDRQDDLRYAFICGSLGDCKAFLYSPKSKTAVDVTARNRGGIDAKDPGGRLGPYLDGGAPDVRNLKVFFELCREGDIVILMTDGVHDNLDPKSLGKEPSDFGYQVAWEALPADTTERIKQGFQAELLSKVLAGATTPKQVVDTLTGYSQKVTRAGREFMEANPRAKQPSDYKAYPGKMDHCTCLAVPVGVQP